MMHRMQLDHVVIFVPSLAQAVSQFTDIGFNVIEGGQHDSTENALIIFEDKSYIELLALKPGLKKSIIRASAALGLINIIARRQTDIRWRLLNWVAQDFGSIDWCVRVEDIDAALKDWSNADIANLGSQSFTRKRLDGILAQWQLGSLKDNDLPFLLSDFAERALRVPTPVKPHPNGALGIRKIWISVQDQKLAKHRFDHCFERIYSDIISNPVYKISNHHIEIVGTDHHRGKCAIALACSGQKTITLDPKKTFGVSISLGFD